MDTIEHYLLLKAIEERFCVKKWTKEISQHVPKQDNYNDCGVFVCMIVRSIAEQTSSQFYLDIPRTRKHIQDELLNSQLLQYMN